MKNTLCGQYGGLMTSSGTSQQEVCNCPVCVYVCERHPATDLFQGLEYSLAVSLHNVTWYGS